MKKHITQNGLTFWILSLLLFSPVPRALAQFSLTSNDGGTGVSGNLYNSLTSINGTASGGAVTLNISGNNNVILNQALPSVSKAVTFLGTLGTDMSVSILGQNEAQSAVTFLGNLFLGDSVTLGLANTSNAGAGSADASLNLNGLSLGTTSVLGATAGNGANGANSCCAGTAGGNGTIGGSVTLAVSGPSFSAGSQLTATGGNGGSGGNGYSASAGNGANGGSAALTLTGNSNVAAASVTIQVTGGVGGKDGLNDSGAVGITGSGGAASATIVSLTYSGTGDSFSLTGGRGGAGANDNISGGMEGNGPGGTGGNSSGTLSQGVTLSGNSDHFTVAGGAGGNGGGDAIQGNNAGAGGTGGAASVTLNNVNLSGSGNGFSVAGGNGGNGGAAWDTSGAGGKGGAASATVTGLFLSGSGDSFLVTGGHGGTAGAATYNPSGPGNGGAASLGVSQLSLSAGTTLSVMGGTGASAGSASLTITNLTGSGTVTLSGSSTSLQVGGGNFSGVIGGNEALSVAAGLGTLTLSGTNTYTGGTQLISGGLLLTGTGVLGSAGLTMASGTFFDISGATAGVNLPSLSGSGSVSLGGNSLTVGSNNSSQTYSGTLFDGGASGGTGASLTKTGSGTYNFSNTVSIGGAVTVSGGGFNASGNDTFGGGLVVSSGNVTFSGADSFGAGVAVSGGNVTISNNDSFGGGAAVSGGSLIFSGDNSFNGSMNVTGGQLQLLGTNIYSGGTTVVNGILTAGSVASMGSTATSLVLNNASFVFANGFDLSRSVSLSGSAVTFNTNGKSDSLSATLTGTTAVVVNGGGSLTLTAANSYSAATTVSGASLYLTGTGTLGTGNFTDNGHFDFSGETQAVTLSALSGSGSVSMGGNGLVLGGGNGNFQFDGSLNDGGASGGTGASLTKTGTGLMTLTQYNPYTGGTTLLSGGIFLNGGTIGSGPAPGALVMSAGTTFDTSGTYDVVLSSISGAGLIRAGGSYLDLRNFDAPATFSGTIVDGGLAGGTGGFLSLQGTGTLTLTGANTYSGGTYLSGGSLVLTGSGNIGHGGLDLSGASFDMSGATSPISIASLAGDGGVHLGGNNLTLGDNTNSGFSGVVSDGGLAGGTGGSLTKVGTGTLYLSGTNTYTGGTSVAAGKLYLTGNGSVGTGDLFLNSGTVLDAGAVTGPVSFGSLTGSGNVSLGGNNLVEGSDNASTTFSGSVNDGGFAPLTGASLTKVGTGAWTLEGLNSYTGGTLVLQGVLAAGTTLALGTGPVSVEGGTLMTDGSNHRINVAANYTQGSQGGLGLGFGGYNSGQYDQMVVNGIASISGTLDTYSYAGFQPQWGSVFVALSAINLVGRFDQIQSSIPGVRLYAIYEPNALFLEAMPGSFALVGGNDNQKALGTDLDGLFNNPQETNLMTSLGSLTSSAAYQKALGQMSPEGFTGLYQTALSQSLLQASVIGARMDSFSQTGQGNNAAARRFPVNGDSPWFASTLSPAEEARMSGSRDESAWSGNIGWTSTGFSVGSTSGAQGFQQSSGGLFTANLDKRVSPSLYVGFLLGYGSSNLSMNGGGTLGQNGAQLGAYATWMKDGFYIKGLALGGYNSYTSQRVGFGGTASGATQGDQYGGLLGVGYDFKEKQFTLGPLASMQYARVNIAAFTEQGSLAPLSLSAQGVDSLLGQFGARANGNFDLGGVSLTPGVSLAWEHEFNYQGGQLAAGFGQGDSFTVAGPAIGQDGLLLGAGLDAALAKDLKITLQYQGELSRTNLTSNQFGGGIGLSL